MTLAIRWICPAILAALACSGGLATAEDRPAIVLPASAAEVHGSMLRC